MDTLPTADKLKSVAVRDYVANELRKVSYRPSRTLQLTFDVGPEVAAELEAKGYHVACTKSAMSNLWAEYTIITW
jgi:hypothetical protein